MTYTMEQTLTIYSTILPIPLLLHFIAYVVLRIIRMARAHK